MTDQLRNDILRLRMDSLEGQLKTLKERYAWLYDFVESLQQHVERLPGWPRIDDPAGRTRPSESIDQLRNERDDLAEWKRQHKLVDNWWYEIDTYVREHPSTVPGESVVDAALRLLRERDSFARTLKSFSEATKAIHIKSLDFPCPTS